MLVTYPNVDRVCANMASWPCTVDLDNRSLVLLCGDYVCSGDHCSPLLPCILWPCLVVLGAHTCQSGQDLYINVGFVYTASPPHCIRVKGPVSRLGFRQGEFYCCPQKASVMITRNMKFENVKAEKHFEITHVCTYVTGNGQANVESKDTSE